MLFIRSDKRLDILGPSHFLHGHTRWYVLLFCNGARIH